MLQCRRTTALRPSRPAAHAAPRRPVAPIRAQFAPSRNAIMALPVLARRHLATAGRGASKKSASETIGETEKGQRLSQKEVDDLLSNIKSDAADKQAREDLKKMGVGSTNYLDAEDEAAFETPADLAAFQQELGELDSGPINDPELMRNLLSKGIPKDTLASLAEQAGEELPEDLAQEDAEGANEARPDAGISAGNTVIDQQATELLTTANNMDPIEMAEGLDKLQAEIADTRTEFERPSKLGWWRAIRSFANEGHPAKAESELKALEENISEPVPMEVFADIIFAYCKKAEELATPEAVYSFEKLLLTRENPSYKSTRATPAVVEQLEHAVALLRRSLKADLKPEWQVCETVINKLGEFGQVSKAESVLELLTEAGVDGITATGLLAAQLRDGNHAAAEKTAARIPTDNVHAQEASYLAHMRMVMEACTAKHWDSAASYITKCSPTTQPRLQAYMLHALTKSGDLKRAEKVLTDLENGSPESLDAMPYLSFAVHFIRAGDVSAARKWVKRMSERMGGMPSMSYLPLLTNLTVLVGQAKAPEATITEASAWLAELEAVPEDQRALPKIPGAPTVPTADELADLRKRIEAMKTAMPESLRKWMVKPTGELSAENRNWLMTSVADASSGRDKSTMASAVLYSMLDEQLKEQPTA